MNIKHGMFSSKLEIISLLVVSKQGVWQSRKFSFNMMGHQIWLFSEAFCSNIAPSTINICLHKRRPSMEGYAKGCWWALAGLLIGWSGLWDTRRVRAWSLVGAHVSLSLPHLFSHILGGGFFFFLKAANGSCLRELGDGGLWIKGRFTFSYLLFGCFYHYCAIVKNILEKLTSPF